MAAKKGGRKPVPTSSIRVKRIHELMKREHIKTQEEFAQRINTSQQNFSRIMKSEKISEQKIQDIIVAFPDYRIEWLLGYDEIPTHTEEEAARERFHIVNAPIMVLEKALREVCARENVEVPVLDNIPELLLLEAQLKDYAVSLMWNYVKWRDASSFWSYLDQIENKKAGQ